MGKAVEKRRKVKEPDVLTTAHELIRGQRQSDYGSPKENFSRIATAWSTYLDVDLSPLDVCAMMVLLKVARLADRGDFHRDTVVDIAGYAGLMEMVQ